VLVLAAIVTEGVSSSMIIDKTRGCISLAANLDSIVTDKRQVSSLFVRIS